MLNQNDIETIQRYLDGKSSHEEVLWVESLFANGYRSPGLHKFLFHDWHTFAPENNFNLSNLLDRVHHLIWKKELRKQKSISHRFIQTYSRAAAILLLPLVIAGIWFFQLRGTEVPMVVEQTVSPVIYAPYGSRVAFNLPDGTTGFLNSGSKLTYTMPFSQNRKVTLVGEAWFNVKTDRSHPFEIGAGASAVTALGTSFNISAYPDENYVELVLEEGIVEFRATPNSQTLRLEPADRLVFNGQTIDLAKTEPAKYNGWTSGKLIFRADKMNEVARRIERWYNVKVEIADKELESYIFRGTFEDDSLDEVFRLLSMTSPIRYRITPRRLKPDGEWEKEKVIVFKRRT